MSGPRVSVILPVFNAERFVREAIESILSQTFRDFELILIDDASTDASGGIVDSFRTDPRVKIIHHDVNRKLIATLNEGIKLARGEYIARMDSDDVANPMRFEKQVKFLDLNPEVGVCGTWFRYIGKPVIIQPPAEDANIRLELLFDNPIGHPTVMLRRKVLIDTGLCYDERDQHVEDYALWTRLALKIRFAVIPEILLDYRIHGDQISSLYAPVQAYRNFELQQQYAESVFGKDSPVVRNFRELRNRMGMGRDADPGCVARFSSSLLEANRSLGFCDQAVVERYLYRKFYEPKMHPGAPFSPVIYISATKNFPPQMGKLVFTKLLLNHATKYCLRRMGVTRIWHSIRDWRRRRF